MTSLLLMRRFLFILSYGTFGSLKKDYSLVSEWFQLEPPRLIPTLKFFFHAPYSLFLGCALKYRYNI